MTDTDSLDFAPLLLFLQDRFPKAMQLSVVDVDGVLRPPLGVQWQTFLPITLLEAMGIVVTITKPDGSVLTAQEYGEMVAEAMDQRDRREHPVT